MTVHLSIRSTLCDRDAEIFEKTCSEYFGDIKLDVDYDTRQIDPSAITIPSAVITTVAAVLYIYITLRDEITRLTYPRLLKRISSKMAEKGIKDIDVHDVSNFRSSTERRMTEPCVVTIRDTRQDRLYRVFYYGKNTMFAIEIQEL